MPVRNPPFISDRTVSRRTLLEWLGKGTVLALGSPILKACATLDAGATDADAPVPDADAAGEVDARPDAAADEGEAEAVDAAEARGEVGANEFPFQEGSDDLDIYRGWNVRTVDTQDVGRILETWRLDVDGMVDNPLSLTFADVIALSRQDQLMDFHCVEGWSVYDVPWNGVHLSTILELARVRDSASYVAFHTVDDRYNESLRREVALEPHTMLGYGVGGYTLPLEHGFPLRVVAPRLLGYKNAKYVRRLELRTTPLEGYWVRAGYPYEGEVPPSRLREGRY
ncbi:MAG: molybdopterin-dependent oxidoreductase [Deltaproteobacteria bacterium]|nr:molybdopterin-dependent oxidoreductase [Deltaproteobacteria bacterium]